MSTRRWSMPLVAASVAACGGTSGSGPTNASRDMANSADAAIAEVADGSMPPGPPSDAHFDCPVDRPQRAFGAGGTAVLDADTTWTADNVYIVLGAFSTGMHTLTIEPGTVVCFDYDDSSEGSSLPGSLEVATGGALVATGTASSHVTFTHKESGQPGYAWTGIEFDSGFESATSLAYVDFYDAGSGPALRSQSTGADGTGADPALAIDHVELFNLERQGIALRGANGWTGSIAIHGYTATGAASTYPAATIHPLFAANMTATSLTVDGSVPTSARVIQLGESILGRPVTLHDVGIPYRSDPAGIQLYGEGHPGAAGVQTAVLTIDPGVTLQMSGLLDVGYHADAAADLVAAGTAARPISFVPADSSWTGILFEMDEVRADVSKLDHVLVSGAGKPGEVTITDCRDMQSSTIGGEVMIEGPSGGGATYAGPAITNSTFSMPSASTDGIRYDCTPGACLATDYVTAGGNTFTGFPATCDASNVMAVCAARPLGCN